MKDIKGTQTERNVLLAFSGESQARNRYTFYAKKAHEDGFVFVRDIFEETANQESQHAKTLFKFLQGGEVNIAGAFPAGVISDTYHNLLESAAGEHHEWDVMYPEMAKIADQEGFKEIANVMRAIRSAESYHEKRYLMLAEMIKNNTMFNADQEVEWRCLNCGAIVTGREAPKACPACFHPTSWFVRLSWSFDN